MPRNSREVGNEGEAIALRYLKSKGYKKIAQSYRCRWGEIDIIARRKERIIFVEVKYRRGQSHGSAAESVTPQKQQRIIKTALHWLQSEAIPVDSVALRFDVIAILASEGAKPQLEHIEGAFSSS